MLPSGSVVKNLPANAGDPGLISGLGRFPGERNSNPFQYSCLENPMDRGAWWATVHGVRKRLQSVGSQRVRHVLSRFSHVRVSVTLWTMACQAPLSMGFSRQEYWSGLPFPSANLIWDKPKWPPQEGRWTERLKKTKQCLWMLASCLTPAYPEKAWWSTRKSAVRRERQTTLIWNQ